MISNIKENFNYMLQGDTKKIIYGVWIIIYLNKMVLSYKRIFKEVQIPYYTIEYPWQMFSRVIQDTVLKQIRTISTHKHLYSLLCSQYSVLFVTI